jgi:2-polyprenyl-3-methyl-5-hydroxy-6-metoxy-1,4-benzoquinol methylase
MKDISSCPLCGKSDLKSVRKAPYYRGEHEVFNIDECSSCGFWFTNPQPEGVDLASYYESDNYVSHTDGTGSLLDFVYNRVRDYALNKKLSLVDKAVSQKNTLLDYGAGTGAFLVTAKAKGWKVMGVEPSALARDNANGKGVSLLSVEGRDAVQNSSCSAISLWHVLEHLPDLKESMEYFNSKLEDKGVLFIAVPNHQSHDAGYYQNNWAALDVPLHLWHFTKKDLNSLAVEAGFVLEQVHNMPFDSFYVSLLSEKIRKSNFGPIRALYRGIVSNLKGRNQKNMSSLIYQLRKV